MKWIDKLKFWDKEKTVVQKGGFLLRNLSKENRPTEIPDLMNNYNQIGLGNNFTGLQPADLKEIALFSDIIYNIFTTLKFEMFRNGYDKEQKNKDIQIDEEELKAQEKRIDDFIFKCNDNGQALNDVLSQMEDDLNTYDDTYGLLSKTYEITENNQINRGEVDEFIRLNPLTTIIVHDKKQRIGRNDKGEKVYFSLKNRSALTTDPIDKKTGYPNLRACYKVIGEGAENCKYYDSTEIIHISKYRPSRLYGFSPLFSLYNKISIIVKQDRYMKDYYSGDKAPKSILVANTSNAASFKSSLKEWKNKSRQNPHGVHPITNEKAPGDNSPVFEFINLMNTMEEMQYTQTRDEIRRNISALFGVSPVFMNDASTGGGLNNEGLQITVTNRAIELGQTIYNSKVLPFIFGQMGITYWNVKLKPSEEQDEVKEKDLRLKTLQIAKATAELGIVVNMDKNGDFIYEPGKVELNSNTDFVPFGETNVTLSKSKAVSKSPINITKAENLIPVQEQNKLITSFDKEIEKVLKTLDRKRKPTEEEFNDIVNKIVGKIDKRLKSKSSGRLKTIYQKSMKKVEREIGDKLTFGEKDRNILDALKKEPVYQKAFSGVSKNMSTRLKKVITTSYDEPGKFSINKIIENMKLELDKSENELRTIARTETSKISAAARKTSYEKTGATYKYFHIGPDDYRTTKASKEMVNLTKSGVSWDEYVNLIKNVSSKYNKGWIVNENAPITHPNTRHIFIAERA